MYVFGPSSPSSAASPLNFLFLELTGRGLNTKKDVSMGRDGIDVLTDSILITGGIFWTLVACLAVVGMSDRLTGGVAVLSRSI